MRINPFLAPATGFVLILCGILPPSTYAGDPVAEARLAHKGLTRSGHAFVVEAEAPILEKMKLLKVALSAYNASVQRRTEAEQVGAEVAQIEQQRTQLLSDLDDLTQQIDLQAGQSLGGFGRGPGPNNFSQNSFPSQAIAQKLRLKGNLAQLRLQEQRVREQAPQGQDREDLDETYREQKEKLRTLINELRPEVDGLRRQYADLAADAMVKQALADAKRAARVKLGPSDAFLAGETLLARVERAVLGKSAASLSRKTRGKARR